MNTTIMKIYQLYNGTFTGVQVMVMSCYAEIREFLLRSYLA